MKPLTLALAGLEQDDVTDFRRVFGKLRGQLGADWRMTDDLDADLVVVDIDSIHGHMDWLKLTANGMRTAVYTAGRYAKESDLCLFKPLQADNLGEMLAVVAGEHGIEARLQSPVAEAPEHGPVVVSVVAAAKAAAPVKALHMAAASPAALHRSANVGSRQIPAVKSVRSVVKMDDSVGESPAAHAEPAPVTIGEWLLAGKFSKPVSIQAGDDVWVLDPDRDAYHGPATLNPLLPALQHTLSSVKDVDVVTLEGARKHSAQPLSRLRWFAGLNARPGKLSAGLSHEDRFKLARWPQIEREYPRHFRIATAMMKEAGSVREIADASGAPMGDVADFINACQALGHIQVEGNAVMAGHAARGGGMMSRLRSSLGR